MTRKIGITGGIGSGKTTACKVFEILGIPVYYSDEAAKEILDEDRQVRSYLLAAFGQDVIGADGKADRKKIADKVFADKEALAGLNAVVHPAVGRHFDNWVKQQRSPYILKEAAILFESGAHQQVDLVITIVAPEELRIARAMKRNGLSREEVTRRMSSQMSDEEKIKRSAYTLINDESSLLIPQVLAIHSDLLK
ncbi:MAG: dephospho-CoA kinase [Bacteroidia bacterium]